MVIDILSDSPSSVNFVFVGLNQFQFASLFAIPIPSILCDILF